MNISLGISEETTTTKLKFSKLPKGFTEKQGCEVNKELRTPGPVHKYQPQRILTVFTSQELSSPVSIQCVPLNLNLSKQGCHSVVSHQCSDLESSSSSRNFYSTRLSGITEFTDGQRLIFKTPEYLNQVTGKLSVFLQSQVPSLTFWKTCSSLS